MMHGNGLKKLLGLLALAGLVAISGCGRKGPLEAPPGSVSPAASQDETAAPVEEDRRIVLDALI